MNCQSCGEELKDAKFCPNCGMEHVENRLSGKTHEKKPKKSNAKALIIILVIVGSFIFFICAVIFLLVIYNAYFTTS